MILAFQKVLENEPDTFNIPTMCFATEPGSEKLHSDAMTDRQYWGEEDPALPLEAAG